MEKGRLRSYFRKKPGRILGIILVAALAIVLYCTFLLPKLVRIDPVAFGPDGIVTLYGRNFGTTRAGSRVTIDDAIATVSSYLAWNDDSISLRLPGSADSAVIRVKTAFGTSAARIALNSSLVPLPAQINARHSTGPAISSVKPSEASVGSLVEVEGINFGSAANVSRILFSRISPDADGSLFISIQNPEFYERWDDKRILVRVPEGAGTGVIIVATPQGESEPFTFKVRQGSGSKRLYDPAVYSVKLGVHVTVTAASTDPNLILHLPEPASSISQLPGPSREESLQFIKNQPGIASARISPAVAGDYEVNRTSILTVYGVESELAAYKENFTDGMPAFLKPYLEGDSLVPAGIKEVSSLTVKIVGKEVNLQRKAAALKNWLLKNVKWRESLSDSRAALASVISSGRADSQNYALLATALFRASGIPALPVAGFLAGEGGKGIPHFWLEYFLPSVGWIPYDPVLISGAKPGGFAGGLELASDYFGSLDNRHIAVTRGLVGVRALLDGSERSTRKVVWSFQSIFEEAKDLSFRSNWRDVEIQLIK